MNRYVIGGVDTGEILRSVVCDSDQVDSQVHAGEVLDLSDDANDATHYFSGGAVVPYTAEQADLKLLRREGSTWSNVTMHWLDMRTLMDVKSIQNGLINTERLAANRSSFQFSGKAIACDELSRGDIDAVSGIVALTGALPPGFPGGWKAIDNSYVAIPDRAAWVSFYAAMVSQGTANFNHAQLRKSALLAASTITEAEAVVW